MYIFPSQPIMLRAMSQFYAVLWELRHSIYCYYWYVSCCKCMHELLMCSARAICPDIWDVPLPILLDMSLCATSEWSWT